MFLVFQVFVNSSLDRRWKSGAFNPPLAFRGAAMFLRFERQRCRASPLSSIAGSAGKCARNASAISARLPAPTGRSARESESAFGRQLTRSFSPSAPGVLRAFRSPTRSGSWRRSTRASRGRERPVRTDKASNGTEKAPCPKRKRRFRAREAAFASSTIRGAERQHQATSRPQQT